MSVFTYVTASEDDRILIFEMDSQTGRLAQRGAVNVQGRPAPLAVDPGRRFLYVGRRDVPAVSTFQIDPGTGGLSPLGTVELDTDPCYLATDRSGRFLLSAYYNGGRAGVHSIGEDGDVGSPPVEWLQTAKGAHSMQTDRSNSFAFVPHIGGGTGPNHILQFRFDQGTGRLTPNSPPRVSPPADAEGPRHFCFHPTRDILYFSNEQGCSVTAYDFDSSAGTLSALQTVSTLPDGYDGTNSCAQIQISPSGKFLYAPNRGHNSIACFSIDAATGRLAPIGRVPTEPVPRAIGIDPSGNFLLAAGLESGRLASYRIDGATGELKPLDVYDTGKGPMWVLFASFQS